MTDVAYDRRFAWLLERRNRRGFMEYMALVEGERREQLREIYENSLIEFFKAAWQEIEDRPLSLNWHHYVIAEHLEAISNGQLRNLIINIPPRHTKSLLANVVYPAWVWAQRTRQPLSGPHVKFLTVSYAAKLAEKHGVMMRRLVEGEWYRGLWPHVKLLADQHSREDFANTRGGERMSNSIEGGILGRGGDCIIIDDPSTRRAADSDIERASSLQGMSDLSTRITDPRISAQILIMQRLHVADPTDWALKNWPSDTIHLMFPARFDSTRACFADPRTEDGELLWPEVWPEDQLRRIERGLEALDGDHLSDYAVAGQMQQNPVPRGGGILKDRWLMPWPPLDEATGQIVEGWMETRAGGRKVIKYPALEYVVAAVDTAFTTKQENDFSAMTVWGIWRAEGKGRIETREDGVFVRVAEDYGFPKALLLYGWQKRLTLHGEPEEKPADIDEKDWNAPRFLNARREKWGLVEWVIDTARRYKVDHLLIGALGGGHTLKDELWRLHRHEAFGVELINETGKGDKVARAYAVQHLFSNGQVYVPTFEDGTHPTWCAPLVDEILLFPRAPHDDVMDTTSNALTHLRESGLLERRQEWDREEEELLQYRPMGAGRPVVLPYPL